MAAGLARPASSSAARFWAAGRSGTRARGGLVTLWCTTLGVGFAVLHALPPGEARGVGFAYWTWIFGVSGGAQLLATRAHGRSGGMRILRMAFSALSLLSWNQLAWLLLASIATRVNVAIGGIAVYVVVALTELHSIYRAAHDARIDDP